MKHIFSLGFFFIYLQTPLARDIDQKAFYLPNTDIDVLSYEVKLQIPKLEAVELSAVTKISFTAVNPISKLKLHAKKTAILPQDVSINGSHLKFEFLTDQVLSIDLLKPLNPDDQAEVEIAYAISAAQISNNDRHGLFFDPKQKIFAVEDWPYHTRSWIPSNDNPADPAIFSITVDVPQNITVASNGKLVKQESKDGRDVIGWQISRPIPTYGVNLVVGGISKQEREFCYSTDTVNNTELACSGSTLKLPILLYNGNAENWKAVQESAKAVAFFSSVLGPYPLCKPLNISPWNIQA